jgi:Na+/H+-translocating membrane pyrophosphatase
MKSVGDAAKDMVEEVRRQFKEIPGLMEGTGKPDYKKCVDISTTAALRENDSSGTPCNSFSTLSWLAIRY